MEREQASKFINDLLRLMVSRGGSDLFLTCDFPPAIKVDGKVTKVSPQPLSALHTMALARSVMNDKQAGEFERTKECNFAISPQGIGRFRINAFVQQGSVGMVLRTIPKDLPTIDGLNLPVVLKELALGKRGLVIFVGATGSGKSTSLAAMVNHRNENSFGHIITIEDPIEYYHKHKKAVVTQREVNVDVPSFAEALRRALRQDPDIILVGELRDLETMEAAITAAETGHLVFGTLHTTGAAKTIDRIVNAFPQSQQETIRIQLSTVLQGVISQLLVARVDKPGRVAVFEIMINTPSVAALIRDNKTFRIQSDIQTGSKHGMVTLDSFLLDKWQAGMISEEDVVTKSMDPLTISLKLDELRAAKAETQSQSRK